MEDRDHRAGAAKRHGGQEEHDHGHDKRYGAKQPQLHQGLRMEEFNHHKSDGRHPGNHKEGQNVSGSPSLPDWPGQG